MQGHLREFDLGQVLQVVGIGRQYTGVEVRRGAGLMGTIFIKSGKVVSVDAPDLEGREALFKLFQLSDGYFYVFRTETPDQLPEPLGAVSGLLMEVLGQKDKERSRPSSAVPLRAVPTRAPDTQVPRRPEVVPPPKPVARQPAKTPVPPPVATRVDSMSSLGRKSTPPGARDDTQRTGGDGTRGPGKIVAVASPKGGSGKTTIALNLALSLARQGRSVILVDADINGDVLSAIDARPRAEIGVFDVLLGVAEVEEALLETILPRFKILPAVGGSLPRAEAFLSDHTAGFRQLLQKLAADAEVVIVDTPAGMFGVTHQILSAATHVMGVLQAETVASRSFERFQQGLSGVPEENRPAVLGIVINMLQMRHSASVSVFQSACSDLPGAWLFDTSIPRHQAFLDATTQGVPLRHMDEQAPPAVAFLFDNLAAEVTDRLQLGAVERRPRRLLL
jgi:chromosome partitioning protein